MVVGDDQRAALRFGEVAEHQHGNFSHFQLAGGSESCVAGNDAVVGINENRIRPAELLNGCGNLVDLGSRVGAGVILERNEIAHRSLFDQQCVLTESSST